MNKLKQLCFSFAKIIGLSLGHLFLLVVTKKVAKWQTKPIILWELLRLKFRCFGLFYGLGLCHNLTLPYYQPYKNCSVTLHNPCP